MENATKALLIAGSVLIAILLIAMGVKIFNSTQGTTESVQTVMSSTEAAVFNNQFNKYINKSKLTVSDMRSLLQTIIASNASNPSHQVSCSVTEEELNSGKYSYFTLTTGVEDGNPKYDSNGYITTLTYDRYDKNKKIIE